ncbi:hypothetical protein ACHAWC_005470 [Mediolabrus comicus]
MFKSIVQRTLRVSARRTVVCGLQQQQVATRAFATSGFPPPRLFDYETVTSNLTVADAIESVEAAFKALAKGKVDVPMPMHIGIEESSVAGPGDCHIKGGYVSATPTFTVKLACVSFYKNVEKNLEQDVVGFIGCGAIAKNMARAAATVRPIKGIAYALEGAEEFAAEMSAELGVPFEVVSSAEELCGKSDIIYTQTPGGSTVLEKDWLNPKGVTIIASGSDQPTKCEIPPDVLAASKYISDLTKQTSKVGELRSALAAGVMTEDDVHAELGEVVNGDKAGREGNEIIVVDLTGTGAQDAAIGQVAWDKLSQL